MALPGQQDPNQPTNPDSSSTLPKSSVNDPGQSQFQTNQAGQRQQGTGFTNIGKMLQAGQGSGQQMGQAIGQGIGQQAGQFQQGLGTAQEQFGTANQAGTYDPSAGSKDTQAVASGIQSAMSGTAPGNAGDFSKYLSGQYTGPTTLSNTSQLANQANTAQNLGQATTNQYGRQGLLQQFAGKGQYTGGEQTLDNLLLSQGGLGSLNAARQQTAGLGSQLNQAQQQAANTAQQSGLTNQAFANQTLSQLGGAAQGVGSTVAGNAAQQQAANDVAKQQALSLQGVIDQARGVGSVDRMGHPTNISMTPDQFFSANKQLLTPDVLQKLGLTGNEMAGNIDLSKLSQEIQPGDTAVTSGQALNADQARQLQALQSLAQSGGKDVLGQTGINQGDIGRVTASGYTAPGAYNPYVVPTDLTTLQSGAGTAAQAPIQQHMQYLQGQIAQEQQAAAAGGDSGYNNAGHLADLQNQLKQDQANLASPQFQTIQKLLADQGSPVTARI